jgi:uncharacterized membrane protein
MKRLFLRSAPFVVGTLLVSGIVHIAVMLLIPHVATLNASARLSAQAQINTLELLQPTETGNETLALPFADPSMVTAICRYDLSAGAVRLRLPVSESFLSVALLSTAGQVIVSLTDRAATRRVLDVLLVTPEQQRQLEAQDPDDEPVQEIRIRLAQTSGVALIRGLAQRDAEKKAMVSLLERAICKQE